MLRGSVIKYQAGNEKPNRFIHPKLRAVHSPARIHWPAKGSVEDGAKTLKTNQKKSKVVNP